MGVASIRRSTSWLTRTRRGRREPHTFRLVLVGIVMAACMAVHVLNLPTMNYHPARHGELEATYQTYRDTGVLLIKPYGTGSWYGAVEGTGMTRGALDDDPGTYLAASLMSHLTDAKSPYRGLEWLVALVAALPMLVLPLAMARLFGRAIAGYAMVVVPFAWWFLHHGAVLLGSEYGKHDLASAKPVYALYGLAGSWAFALLVAMVFLASRRRAVATLVVATLAIAVLAGFGNLLRSMSGLGVAAGLGAVWWYSTSGMRWWSRSATIVTAVACAAGISLLVPKVVMDRVESQRKNVVAQESDPLATTNGIWDNMYLGLSYPTPMTGEKSPFGVTWADQDAWTAAKIRDDSARPGTDRFNEIMREVYFEIAIDRTKDTIRLYVDKFFYTARYFAAVAALVAVGLVAALLTGVLDRRRIILVLGSVAPLFVLGLLPPILVMPMLYYITELTAVASMLLAVAIAALAVVAVDARRRRRGSRTSIDAVERPAVEVPVAEVAAPVEVLA